MSGGIGGHQIKDGSISGSSANSGGVTGDLKPGTVSTPDLRDEAVSEAKLAPAVTAKLNALAVEVADSATFQLTKMYDSVRDKQLSSDMQAFVFSGGVVTDLTWLRFFDSAAVGFDDTCKLIMPNAGTIVGVSYHCADASDGDFDFSLYIDSTEHTGLASITGTSSTVVNQQQGYANNLNVDFNAGQGLRVRALKTSGGDIDHLNVVLFIRWR